jgi:hypothetical protein
VLITLGLALFDSWIEAWGRMIACRNYDVYLCYVHACMLIQCCAWLCLFRRCVLSKVFVCELTWKLGVWLLPQCVLYAGKYGTCFVPLQKSLIENATMAKMYCHAYRLGTAKLISKSGFFSVHSCQLSAWGPWASCYVAVLICCNFSNTVTHSHHITLLLQMCYVCAKIF